MIFQEPMTSLDPLYTIGRQMAEPLVKHGGLSWKAGARPRAGASAKPCGIDDPATAYLMPGRMSFLAVSASG